MTATHTGRVRVTVQRHDHEPAPAPEEWEEVVEAPFVPPDGPVALIDWVDERWWPLALEPIGHRVRYCAAGMGEATAATGLDLDELAPDRYLLQFWPDPDGATRPDAVLRQTSEPAAYWHAYARELPPPPTAVERAAAE